MKGKLIVTTVASIALLGALAASASGAANVSLLIRHQAHGCHTWSVNGGPFNASQAITLRRGSFLTITNNDVMPHTLVKTAGPSARVVNLKTGMMGMGMHGYAAPGAMTHMGASVKVLFTHPGVYRFTTRAGEDYASMPEMKTIGEDNTLRLTVKVS